MSAPDVAVVGGGILGLATAALLAEAGAAVRVYERDELAAGASGRNSGVLQHPLDSVLAPLYADSLALYGELEGFPRDAEPRGILVLSPDPGALAAEHAGLATRFPDLAIEWLDPDALAASEPGLAPGLVAYRLDEARPVPPGAAAAGFAARAQRAGARVSEGTAAMAAIADGRVTGVHTPGGHEPAGAVVIAAGAWSAAALPEELAPPVGPLWGVVTELELGAPPRHVLEESGVDALTAPGGAVPRLFSIVTAAGRSALGSCFVRERPDSEAVARELVEHGTRFLPALRDAAPGRVRACARPESADGHPFLGPVPGVEGLHLATGHGAWGVTLGPGSARRVAAAVLGEADAIPPALAAGRAPRVSRGR